MSGSWKTLSPGGTVVAFGSSISAELAELVAAHTPAAVQEAHSVVVISSPSKRAAAEAKRLCDGLGGVFKAVHYFPDAVEQVPEGVLDQVLTLPGHHAAAPLRAPFHRRPWTSWPIFPIGVAAW